MAADRASASVPAGESLTAASLFLLLMAAVDEGAVADLVLQPGVPVVAEGGEVVDPGRGRLGALLAVAGAGLGVAVPADGERDGGPGGLPAGPDLDAGQVERVEDQLDVPPGEPGVDLVGVAVQGHQGGLGRPAPLGPQERLAQPSRVGDGPLGRGGPRP